MLHKVGASGFDVTLKHLILEDGDAILGDVVSPFDKSGGGIFVDEGITLTLEDSVVRDSAAEEGGGLYSLGTTTIERSSFVNNNADDGGGVANVGVGILTVKASTISGNNAGNGGGIYSTGTLTVQASQLTQNQAFGGVIRGGVSFGEGGAVYVTSVRK